MARRYRYATIGPPPKKAREPVARVIIMGFVIPVIAIMPVLLFYYLLVLRSPKTDFSDSKFPRVGFRKSSGRDTMGIVWGCVSTLLVCVISTAHLSCHENKSHRLSTGRKLRSMAFYAKLIGKLYIWTLCALLIPEVLASLACVDYVEACHDVTFMKGKKDGWTLKHAHFARMGGFKLAGGGKVHSGKEFYEKDPQLLDRLNLDAIGNDISDKSKANVIAKLLAMLQLLRFSLGIFGRWAAGLSICPMEWATFAYVPCALLTYFFWMEKPFNTSFPCMHISSTTLTYATALAIAAVD